MWSRRYRVGASCKSPTFYGWLWFLKKIICKYIIIKFGPLTVIRLSNFYIYIFNINVIQSYCILACICYTHMGHHCSIYYKSITMGNEQMYIYGLYFTFLIIISFCHILQSTNFIDCDFSLDAYMMSNFFFFS